MKFIKNYNDFIIENNIPDISLNINDLINPFIENKLDLFNTFKLDKNIISVNDNINDLYTNTLFNKFLIDNDFKKGKLENSIDNETLINNNYILYFFFIFNKNEIEIEEPVYIILQYYTKDKNELSDIMVFKNNNNVKDFYKKLTDSTIEIKKGKNTYVYSTYNSGNNYDLKNPKNANKNFKLSIDNNELANLLKNKTTEITKWN